MREILFRGKQIDNRAWVYGVPCEFEIEVMIVKRLFDFGEYDCIGAYKTTIDKETVGQYTGLTDKNGNRIFEGDIIEMPDRKRFVVVYKAGGFDAAPIDWIGEFDKTLSYNTLGEVQNANCIKESGIIIGNIYDNPELLRSDSDVDTSKK